jgi:serine/threonine protein kinase
VNPERWRQLKDLFEAARELDAPQRADFLDWACSRDSALKREAEALLSHHESGDSFLEKPAYEESAALFASDLDLSLEGKRLGPYAVTRKLGEGGMGIVYLAQDTRLGRPVAIKALPPRFTRDERLRARLRSEAVAAARLAHPGIATIYALEEIDGNLFLVREYVRGRTLREELSREPFSTALLLEIAVETARALAAAHEQGVVHRDLKPENVIRLEGGGIKILDFGLARFLETKPVGDSVGDTRLTQSGTFVGTPAYASPEQLLGAEVDFRTDIFSFGVLLFELAAGTHPFAAPDPVSSIARVFDTDDLDLSPVTSNGPPELGRIVRRCLRKHLPQRYGSTTDLLADLERLRASVGGSGSPETAREETPESPEPRSRVIRPKPLWWWQCHQAVVGSIYCLMIYPLWRVWGWTESPWGELIFFPALAAVAVAANLRFHLWFTSAFYPLELREQQGRASKWIRVADIAFATLLLAGALAIYGSHGLVATLLVGVATASLVQATLIEPTTTRAAFRSPEE